MSESAAFPAVISGRSAGGLWWLLRVALDGGFGAGGVAVVHQALAIAQAPEWRGAELVCGGLVQVFGLGGGGMPSPVPTSCSRKSL
jgi:hypothetical protein